MALAETPRQPRERVDRLQRAVLAPCCYTESVAIHQSEIAVKMRLEIARWVAMGESDRAILDTYVGLYGSKVLVDPRTVPRGWTPFVPWLVLILGVFLVAWLLKRWRVVPRTATALSTAEVENLPDLDDD
ncbi:MAG: cytochrome c-type biogenesis protein CcmH [Bryobacteraceae bacterium]|jgi:cytochrome c-type biogenesis protein CcmH/NrfF